MAKKVKAKTKKDSAKSKKGTKLKCNLCGMTVIVDKVCGCDSCAITCCGEDMVEVCGCKCS